MQTFGFGIMIADPEFKSTLNIKAFKATMERWASRFSWKAAASLFNKPKQSKRKYTKGKY